jgi:uncharacterized protein YdeI (YjbR/CyaY-like superfamily)
MTNAGDIPTLACETQHEWEAWLDVHHADTPAVWLTFAKKESGAASITYTEAVESALCYGWIDGQAASVDDRYWRQRFTPRRAKSVWSRVNREKATALIAVGRMRPAGLRQVEQAQANGRWDAAYDGQRTIAVPDDLRRALDGQPEAAAFFATLDSRNRYAVLYRVQTAQKPETRAARIEKYVAMLAAGRKIYP